MLQMTRTLAFFLNEAYIAYYQSPEHNVSRNNILLQVFHIDQLDNSYCRFNGEKIEESCEV